MSPNLEARLSGLEATAQKRVSKNQQRALDTLRRAGAKKAVETLEVILGIDSSVAQDAIMEARLLRAKLGR